MSEDKWNLNDSRIDFLKDKKKEPEKLKGNFKVLIADDEAEVHNVTKLLLRNFVFEEKGLEFIDTYSAKETKEVLAATENIAVIYLDVVMEHSHSGLEVVEYIRKDLDNHIIRIILRTGQPGEAPEQDIIQKYDINDYRIKTELTVRRLFTSLYSAIRSYRDLRKLERHQKGLEQIIRSSSSLFTSNSLEDFLTSILEELGSFHPDDSDVVYARADRNEETDGVVTMQECKEINIVAATGRYKSYIGQNLEGVQELSNLSKFLCASLDEENSEVISRIEDGFVICNRSKGLADNYVYINGDPETFDFDLISLFLSNFSIALDNFMLNRQLTATQNEFVYALADTIETHFEEAGQHNKRIAVMMYQFALVNNSSFQEAEMIRLASIMHDLGKVAIPDSILKKPTSLTEAEFQTVKQHSDNGYNILKNSELSILKTAADIALHHHERFDGTGYPEGLKAQNIPLNSRMLAIVDVFDAVTHKRCYSQACSKKEAIQIIINGTGKHFDPALADLFLDHLETILADTDIGGESPKT